MKLQDALDEIRLAGYSDAKIAKIIGCSQPTITRLRNGGYTNTSFDFGEKIISLYKLLINK